MLQVQEREGQMEMIRGGGKGRVDVDVDAANAALEALGRREDDKGG